MQVFGKIDFQLVFFYFSSVIDITCLQGIQNRAARIVFQVPHPHPSFELLDSLHWLPIEK